MFKEGAGNIYPRLTQMRHTCKHIFYYTLKFRKSFTR